MTFRGAPVLAAAVLALVGNADAQPHSKSRAECDVLRRAVVTTVEAALRTFGEFAPYGAGLTSSREVVPLSEGSAEAAGQHGDATTALRNRLASALRSGEVRATALAYEAKVLSPPETFKTDAIGIALQHQDGYSAIYVIPYRLDAGKVTLGKPEVIEQRPARRGM